MTTVRKPAFASFSRCRKMSGLPPTSSMDLGTRSVSGRMRSPRPAASIIATGAEVCSTLPSGSGHRCAVGDLVEQTQQRGQGPVALGHRAHIGQEARRVLYIGRLAVAVANTRKD